MMGMASCVNGEVKDSESSRPGSVLQAAAVFCGRWLVIAAALAAVIWVVVQLKIVTLPLAVALLLAALSRPFVTMLSRRRVPPSLATAVVLLGAFVVLAGVVLLVVLSVLNNVDALSQQLMASVELARNWAVHGPFNIAPEQLAGVQQRATEWLANNSQQLAQQAWTTTSTVGQLLTGALLSLFALVFFLYDGDRLWQNTCRIVPAGQRARVVEAGQRSFRSLTAFMRATAVVAAVDAAGIGLGLVLVGVPLAAPITALVFLGGFLPVVGAFVSGLVAVLITAVTQGPIAAIIILVVVLAVQQLEGNVLQPWLLGDAVRIHPVAIVFGVTGGATIAGVGGALLAVPLMTTLHTAVRTWMSSARSPGGSPPGGSGSSSAAHREDVEG